MRTFIAKYEMRQTGTPYEGGIYDVVSGIPRALFSFVYFS
jgi:hypothetical protein